MSPEKQRIAIATACGWTAERVNNGFWRATNQKSGHASEMWLSERNVWSQGIPDYLNDLNACHEIEQVLNSEQSHEYYVQLSMKVNRPFIATAPQRCEAFLRVMGLWEEEEQ